MAKKKEVHPFIGKKIKDIRWMTDEEHEKEGWESGDDRRKTAIIILNDGSKIFPSQDGEGNGPGVHFGTDSTGEGIYVTPIE